MCRTLSRSPDVIDNALKVFVVDGDVININSRNVEAANRQQAPTVSHLQQHEVQREVLNEIQHETADSVRTLWLSTGPLN